MEPTVNRSGRGVPRRHLWLFRDDFTYGNLADEAGRRHPSNGNTVSSSCPSRAVFEPLVWFSRWQSPERDTPHQSVPRGSAGVVHSRSLCSRWFPSYSYSVSNRVSGTDRVFGGPSSSWLCPRDYMNTTQTDRRALQQLTLSTGTARSPWRDCLDRSRGGTRYGRRTPAAAAQRSSAGRSVADGET